MSEQNFDLSAIAEKVTSLIKTNPESLQSFMADPVKSIEKLTGLDLPDEKVNEIIAKVKAMASDIDFSKIDLGKASDLLKKLF